MCIQNENCSNEQKYEVSSSLELLLSHDELERKTLSTFDLIDHACRQVIFEIVIPMKNSVNDVEDINIDIKNLIFNLCSNLESLRQVSKILLKEDELETSIAETSSTFESLPLHVALLRRTLNSLLLTENICNELILEIVKNLKKDTKNHNDILSDVKNLITNLENTYENMFKLLKYVDNDKNLI